jgi:TolA-binding protein
MWKEIFSAIREVFILSEKTEQNKNSVIELRSDFRELETKVTQLSDIVRLLIQDNIRLREESQNARREEANEREKIALKLENEMLKFEKRLPRTSTKKK